MREAETHRDAATQGCRNTQRWKARETQRRDTETYKGKGVLYLDERIVRKEAKKA